MQANHLELPVLTMIFHKPIVKKAMAMRAQQIETTGKTQLFLWLPLETLLIKLISKEVYKKQTKSTLMMSIELL